MKDHPGDEVRVPMTDLEPFMPEPGDKAKILISGQSNETVQVIDYYSNPGKKMFLRLLLYNYKGRVDGGSRFIKRRLGYLFRGIII